LYEKYWGERAHESTYDRLYSTATDQYVDICTDKLIDAGATCLDLSLFSCVKDMYRTLDCYAQQGDQQWIVITPCQTLQDAENQWCGRDFYDRLLEDFNFNPKPPKSTAPPAPHRTKHKGGEDGKGGKGHNRGHGPAHRSNGQHHHRNGGRP
jgi:hypothetical protein